MYGKTKGNAPESLARTMIAKAQEKYGGTDQYKYQELIARNVTGMIYAGKFSEYMS